ncbi:MAG: hypothetical protein JF620_05860 [Mesorhizobium sp.]|nr:hypothetical protein [Mesorhizobium sp.]
MATKTRKPAPARSRAKQPRQVTAGADAALADAKDAKPTFGKAAPRKVVAGATHKAPAKAKKPPKPATSKSGPIRTVASVATGAMVATARLAASVFGRRAKAKAK